MYGGYGVFGSEDVVSAHQHIGSGLDEARGRLVLHSAVYFYEGVASALLDEFLHSFDFTEAVFDELLCAESWVYAHEYDEV